MANLTKQQIKQQDFVDNEIFEMIQRIIPKSKQIDWDIEMIGAIRDVLQKQLVNNKL